MSILNFMREAAGGLAKGISLFVTGRHSYLEMVTTPRIEIRRPL